MEGPCADSEEKREPVGDINTAVVDSLKALDPGRPIREATGERTFRSRRFVPKPEKGDDVEQTSPALRMSQVAPENTLPGRTIPA